jgi:hypothetical protein
MIATPSFGMNAGNSDKNMWPEYKPTSVTLFPTSSLMSSQNKASANRPWG